MKSIASAKKSGKGKGCFMSDNYLMAALIWHFLARYTSSPHTALNLFDRPSLCRDECGFFFVVAPRSSQRRSVRSVLG